MSEKNKLSQSAIKFIIQTRLDENVTNNSFAVIAELVKAKFDIDVTGEACRRQFNKNKENPIFQNQDFSQNNTVVEVKSSQVVNLPATEEESKEIVKTVSNEGNKPKIDFDSLLKRNQTKSNGAFDRKAGDNLSKEDLELLFGQK